MSMLFDLHRAIFEALKEDGPLLSLLGCNTAIHDKVPSQRRFPFITIAEVEDNDWGTDECPGRQALVTLRIWSRGSNRAELYGLSDRVTQIMSALPAAQGATRIVLVTLASATYERDVKARAFRATLRFHCLLEPANF